MPPKVSKNAQTTITNQVAVKCRNTIFSQVTKKVLRLPASKADKSTALTHISADAEGIIASIDGIPITLVAPLYLAAGLYALYHSVGKVVALIVPPVLRKYPVMVGLLVNSLTDISLPCCRCIQRTLCAKSADTLEWRH